MNLIFGNIVDNVSAKKVIKNLDPNAFVSVSPASSVYGEGFEEIKVGIEKKNKN